MWQDQVDWSTAELYQGESSLRGVQPIGPVEDPAHDIVQALAPAVVDAQPDRGQDTVAVLSDSLGGLDERGQPGALGLGDPPVQQLRHLLDAQVTGEDGP